MKLRFRMQDIIVVFIYVSLFISAFGRIRFSLQENEMWYHVYSYSIGIIIVLGFLYFLYLLRRKWNISILLLVILVLYEFFISWLCDLIVFPIIIIDVIPWPLLLAVFYDYSICNDIPKCFKQITIVGIVLLCVISIPNVIEHLATYGRKGAVIAPVYLILGFLPMAYITCSKQSAVLISSLVSVLFLISTKRTAVAIIVLGIIFYLLSEAYIQDTFHEQVRKMVKVFAIIVLAALVGLYLIQRFNINIIERFAMVFQDQGSGRATIWRSVIERYGDASITEKVFGQGFHAVAYKIKIWNRLLYAHNSYLETLYDYGIIGLMFIILIMIKIIRATVSLNKKKDRLAPAISYTMSALLISPMFDYFFEQSSTILPFCVVWGICLGKNASNKNLIC